MPFKIDDSLKFDELDLVKHLNLKHSPFLPIIKDVYNKVKDSLDTRIPVIFPKYTLHNSAHSFRIIQYMSKIVDNLENLSELEIAMLICSALLHDVGMAVSEEDIIAIKSDSFTFSDAKYSSMLKLLKNDEVETLQEFIRRIHAQLSGRYIKDNLRGILQIPKLSNLDFADELALICESHTKGHDWMKVNLQRHLFKGDYVLNCQFIACVLRVADILDIDQQRTPYNLYKLISPKGRSDDEWLQHFIISNTEKINLDPITNLKQVEFHGTAKNADTHRKLLNYIDWVEIEISECVTLLTGQDSRYNLLFDPKPKVYIKPEGYTFAGYKMTLKFDAISSLLMGEKIYGSKNLGLRELIQNSLDACRLRQVSDIREFGEESYSPSVKVILDSEKGEVTIRDNGIGMSLEVLKNHFLNIGVSYYKSFEFLLQNLDYRPIGNYGIGFLSCFMLSDKVKVRTRHFLERYRYDVQLEKGNEWTSLTEVEDSLFFGTEVTLDYFQFMEVFKNNVVLVKEFLSKYFITDNIDFRLIEKPNIFKIDNSMDFKPIVDKGTVKVDLSEYLQDIEGYVILKNKSNFIKNLEEIKLIGSVYIYDKVDVSEDEYEYKFEPLEDSTAVNLDDYIRNNELYYLSVPLVEDKNVEDFLNGMKLIENVEEVIEKLENKLKWISILIPNNEHDNVHGGELEDSYDDLIEGVSFSKLIELGHSDECKTYSSLHKVKLFEGRKNELYLPFDKEEKRWYFMGEGPRRELFVRNVLIKDFEIQLPLIASVFEVVSMVVNIKSRKFIPDISRNKMDNVSTEEINYKIGKAIHQAAIEIMDFGEDEKKVIRDFISQFYSTKVDYEK